MEHFYQNVPGWFTFPNLYKTIVKHSANNSHFVEIGSWLGQSSCFMAVEILNSKKQIKFDCIDTWKGSEEHSDNSHVINDSLFLEFLKNTLPVKQIINPIKNYSIEASKAYKDNSLDFVFIDGSHDYENVKSDIQCWYPKVKPNCIIAGHDYYKSNPYLWPGVKKAVDEFIASNKLKAITTESCWLVSKPSS